MRKPQLVVPAIVLACFLVSGVLIATNMGFKFNYVLNGPGSSLTGTNVIALPFHKQVGMLSAKDLIDDITAAGGNAAQVGRFVNATDSFATYNGVFGTDFALTKSEGYFVSMNTDTEYILFGTHDPGHVVSLAGPGSSSSGLNLYAPPYHTTSITAGELLDEINEAAPDSAVSIQRFDNTTNQIQTHDGVTGYNFPIEPGRAYFVQVSQDVNFVPSHY